MHRRWTAGARTAALLVGLTLAAPGEAQEDLSPFGDPDERQRQLEPLPSLPEGLRGVVRPKAGAEPLARIDTIRDVFLAIQACWQPPAGSGHSGQEITLRLSFKRSGEVLGKPRITFFRAGAPGEEREAFARSVQEAFVRCTPLPFTDRLGGAVAGRPFIFRFVDTRPA